MQMYTQTHILSLWSSTNNLVRLYCQFIVTLVERNEQWKSRKHQSGGGRNGGGKLLNQSKTQLPDWKLGKKHTAKLRFCCRSSPPIVLPIRPQPAQVKEQLEKLESRLKLFRKPPYLCRFFLFSKLVMQK